MKKLIRAFAVWLNLRTVEWVVPHTVIEALTDGRVDDAEAILFKQLPEWENDPSFKAACNSVINAKMQAAVMQIFSSGRLDPETGMPDAPRVH